MQTRITPDEMKAAARQMAKTEAGRAALQRLMTLLGSDNFELSLLNQRAFLALLGGAWNGNGAIVRQAIDAALAQDPAADA